MSRRTGVAWAGLMLAALVVAGCGRGDENEIRVSGTIDAPLVVVSSGTGGRVSEVLVAEGDRVEAGQVLIRLDTSLIEVQIAQAKAVRDAARARLAEVQSPARPEELRAAEAALAQAVAQWRGARQAWDSARAIAANPQELEQQLTAASIQVELAQVRVAGAEDALEVAQARGERVVSSEEARAAAARVEAAEAALAQARAGLDGAQATLDQLQKMREDPLAIQAKVNAAEAAYRQAAAAVEAAQARLELLQAGASQGEIAAAEAELAQAEAALEALEARRSEMTLRAPQAGTVLSRAVEPGELAAPGQALLRIGQLDQVELVVFVPETQIGQVELGQRVEVTVDAFADETFWGEVTSIASEAQFTPRNVQTEEERANLVFEVTITLDNKEGRLRPGMPAEARIEVG